MLGHLGLQIEDVLRSNKYATSFTRSAADYGGQKPAPGATVPSSPHNGAGKTLTQSFLLGQPSFQNTQTPAPSQAYQLGATSGY